MSWEYSLEAGCDIVGLIVMVVALFFFLEDTQDSGVVAGEGDQHDQRPGPRMTSWKKRPMYQMHQKSLISTNHLCILEKYISVVVSVWKSRIVCCSAAHHIQRWSGGLKALSNYRLRSSIQTIYPVQYRQSESRYGICTCGQSDIESSLQPIGCIPGPPKDFRLQKSKKPLVACQSQCQIGTAVCNLNEGASSGEEMPCFLFGAF